MKKELIEWGRAVLLSEGQALFSLVEHVDKSFADCVELLANCQGKVVLSGLGKSGHIAQKISSTLASTGTPSLFLHAAEAQHGDFGMLDKKDCLIALSYGGETRELLAVVNFAKALSIKTIAITGYPSSTLARFADYKLVAAVSQEADTLGLAPTSSAIASLALGDALAVSLMRLKGFSQENFKKLHPGGRLGKSLLRIEDMMHNLDAIGQISEEDDVNRISTCLSEKNFGIVAVLDQKGQVNGVITDGDLRRSISDFKEAFLEKKAKDIMTKMPKSIEKNKHAIDGVNMMERYKVTSLFVMDEKNKPVGLVRLHDLIEGNIV